MFPISAVARGRDPFRMFAPLLVLALAGCGSSTATVTGKVTFRDRALTSGRVVFYCSDADQTVAHGDIRPDGTYTIAKLPAGPARVAVEIADPRTAPEAARGMMDPAKMGNPQAEKPQKPQPEKPRTVPPREVIARYRDPDQSRLTCEVEGGEKEFNINIPLK